MPGILFLDDLDLCSDLHFRHGLCLDIDGAGKLGFCCAAEVECAVAQTLEGDGGFVADAGDLEFRTVDHDVLSGSDLAVDGIYADAVAVILVTL